MDPKHLYYLSVIVQYGSLSKASEHLGVVQPTLTRIVKVLENKVGAPLLTRGRHGMSPTELGENLAAAGSAIAEQMEAAAGAAERWRSGHGEELRVGVGPMLARCAMSTLLEKFLAERWPYHLNLISATAGNLVNHLNADEVDVVIAPSLINMHQESLRQEIVLRDRMAIYGGAKAELHGSPSVIPIAKLVGRPWVAVGAFSSIHKSPKELLDHIGLTGTVTSVIFTGDVSMCLELLRSTSVLVMLPEKLADACPDIRGHKLRVDAPMPARDIAFWSTKANQDRPQIQHFKKQVKAWLDGMFVDEGPPSTP